jgi:hypothetical protein
MSYSATNTATEIHQLIGSFIPSEYCYF